MTGNGEATVTQESPHAAGPGCGIRITGVGAEIPARVVTTTEVEERAGLARFGFEAGWLERVTGVRERRWADPGVLPSDLAAAAGAKALADAGVDAADVDTVIFTGISRDFLEPAVANVVAESLGTRKARVFDLVNACNGLVDGVDVADSLLRSGKARRVLVTTGERASVGINWRPASKEEVVHAAAGLVVGDGGGAFLVEPSDDPERGLRACEFRSDGTQWRHAIGGRITYGGADGAPPECQFDAPFVCHGRELFEAAFGLVFPMMISVMEQNGWGPRDLDIVFCHVPSRRFVESGLALIGKFAKHSAKFWSNVDRYGNVSTCTLPFAMSEAKEAGALAPGSKVLALAPSSGISAAAVTMVW